MNIKMTLFVAAFGLITAVSTQAASVQTTKGDRLSVSGTSAYAALYTSAGKATSCPMMKKTTVTTVRNADSKGHATITETSTGIDHSKCNTIQQRDVASNQVQSVMVCPDGSAQPASCCQK